ncbi:methionine ABC transporter permease [Streptomyces sp. NEAU-YJ-81]|uniref:methionine ABC transporter permease n=1 Tax=Streptomyces sp. NEAU-YJ-81 TaxID=2820288 RepID=UPI001ABCB593|nr:methionine ABC transporter permease [Streptomyces sp. NEAU-YJ-81]MBO3678789.1 ABC transporter permease [Streptomyces sp. NEAU-YJ-81]
MSTDLDKLWPLLFPAIGQTLQMVAAVMLIVVAVGTPVGVVLHNCSPGALFAHRALRATLSWVVNLGRSLPFLILMAAIIPFTRYVAGTTIGVSAAIVPMSLAGIPYFTRLVETALREVPREATEAGRAAGGSRLQVIVSVQLAEALPALAGSLTIAIVGMLEFSAIAGTIGAGGIGYLAISYGYERFDTTVMTATIVTLVVMVQVIQFTGDRVVRHLAH